MHPARARSTPIVWNGGSNGHARLPHRVVKMAATYPHRALRSRTSRNVVVTGRWRVSRTATACTSSIRSYGHELGKTTNLAHAPNYAWTTRFYPILCAMLLLPVLAAAAAAASATTAIHFCHSSVSLSRFLMPFHLASSSVAFWSFCLPFTENSYFPLNTTTENMAYLASKTGHANRNYVRCVCCLGSCLLHYYIPLSFASLFLDTFDLSLDRRQAAPPIRIEDNLLFDSAREYRSLATHATCCVR